MDKILIICDDIWHPAEVVKKGFRCIHDLEWQMDFVMDAKDILTENNLYEYPLIICCKGNNITSGNPAPWFEAGVMEAGPLSFSKYVEHGGGFLSVHASNSYSEQIYGQKEEFSDPCRAFIDFTGNRFLGHPPRCTVELHPIHGCHPIVEDIETFSIYDEHYQIELIAKDAKVILEAASATGNKMPGCYVREIGKGRFCAVMPGHTLSTWKNCNFQRLIKNAAKWCMRK